MTGSATTELDHLFMREALVEADRAAQHGDVPVGAVVVVEDRVIARAENRRELDGDPLGHAEILALRDAARVLKRWRLTGATLYVTLEPCVMCAGAIVQARIDRLVFGTFDPKAGAVGSLYDVPRDARLNHRPVVHGGVEAEAASDVLKTFFQSRRRLRERET